MDAVPTEIQLLNLGLHDAAIAARAPAHDYPKQPVPQRSAVVYAAAPAVNELAPSPTGASLSCLMYFQQPCEEHVSTRLRLNVLLHVIHGLPAELLLLALHNQSTIVFSIVLSHSNDVFDAVDADTQLFRVGASKHVLQRAFLKLLMVSAKAVVLFDQAQAEYAVIVPHGTRCRFRVRVRDF